MHWQPIYMPKSFFYLIHTAFFKVYIGYAKYFIACTLVSLIAAVQFCYYGTQSIIILVHPSYYLRTLISALY